MRVITKAPVTALLVAALFSSGCASISSRRTETKPLVHAAGKVYPGVQYDAAIIYHSVRQLFSEAGPYVVMLVPAVLVDMPLSFICDTVCLPYDICHIGYGATEVWYGGASYWVVKVDRAGERHGKCVFQLSTPRETVWGYVSYEHGIRQGPAEVHGGPWQKGDVRGQFREDREWEGSFLLHADDPNRREFGPLVHYRNGELTGTSDIVLKIRKLGE